MTTRCWLLDILRGIFTTDTRVTLRVTQTRSRMYHLRLLGNVPSPDQDVIVSFLREKIKTKKNGIIIESRKKTLKLENGTESSPRGKVDRQLAAKHPLQVV